MARVCQFLLILIGVFYTSAVGEFFTENPMSVTVTLGGDVHFWCKTAEQFACYNMNWMYASSKTEGHPFGTIGTCRTPNHWDNAVNKRLTQSFEDGRFGLHISNVSYQDSGRYSCWVAKSVAGEAISEYSGVAFLTVLSPVPTPLCRYTPEVVSVSNAVRLICEVPSDANVETIKLSWVYVGPIRGVQVKRGQTYSIPHTLTDSDNYKIFTCVAGTDLTNGPNCTLSPLQIPMTVEITPVFVEDESTYMFFCNADALPPVTNYHWSVQEMDSFSKEWRDVPLNNSQIQNEGTTLILTAGRDIGPIGRRLSTTCTASNSIGLTESSVPVRILQCSSGAIVTEFTWCEDLPETTLTMVISTEEPTGSVGTGGTQGLGDGMGFYVWIIVAAVILLVIVAFVCCIFLVRYRRFTTKSKRTSTEDGHHGLGVAYSATMGSVIDLRSQTGTSESNALMMEAEVVLATSNSTLHQLDTRPAKTAGNSSPRIVALSTSHGLHDGETYASINDSHQTHRANLGLRHSAGDLSSGPHKSIHNDYNAIGPDIFNGTAQRNSSEVDLYEGTYASVGNDQQSKDEIRLPPELSSRPSAYESVDLNISQVHTSVRDSSSLKKVCVVSPTCHLKDGGDNQVVYAMPDKQRKQKIDNGETPRSRPVGEPPSRPGAVYAKPDKKQKKPVEKYGKKSTNNDNTSKPSIKSSPQNVPEGLYAMPDKSPNRSTIFSVNSKDARDGSSDFKSSVPDGELPSKIHNLALSRSNSITPKKPHRTASSKVAGSRILRDSLRRQNDSEGGKSRSMSRSSSTEMDNLESSTPSAVPAELNIARNSDTDSSIPIYTMPDKGSK